MTAHRPRRNWPSHIRRFAGFAAIPALSVVSTVLLLPMISSRFGAEGWTSVALGQAVGAILGVFVGLGWPVVGSHLVATKQSDERSIVFAESLKSRLVALAVAAPIGVGICCVLAHSFVETAVIFVVAIAMNGLTASWYFAGTGEPGKLIRNEAAVRVGGYLAAVIAIYLGAGLWSYGMTTLVAGLLMLAINYGSIVGRQGSVVWRNSRSLRVLAAEHLAGGLSRVVASSSMYSGTIIVAWIAPAVLPLYSAVDQVQKSVVNATSSFPQAMVSWVGSATDEPTLMHRISSSFKFAIIIGGVLFVAWCAIGSEVIELLFTGKVTVPVSLNVLSASLIALVAVSQSLASLVMVPLGLYRFVYSATVVSAIVGIAAAIAGAYLFEAEGALAGLAFSYALLLSGYMFVYWRRRRSIVRPQRRNGMRPRGNLSGDQSGATAYAERDVRTDVEL